jgi:hypothetical protein
MQIDGKKGDKKGEGKTKGTYKKLPRNVEGKSLADGGVQVGGKRGGEFEEDDIVAKKRRREEAAVVGDDFQSSEAGLADQLREQK